MIDKQMIIKDIYFTATKMNNDKELDKKDIKKISNLLDELLDNKKINKFFKRID
jgi:hypothetical protein